MQLHALATFLTSLMPRPSSGQEPTIFQTSPMPTRLRRLKRACRNHLMTLTTGICVGYNHIYLWPSGDLLLLQCNKCFSLGLELRVDRNNVLVSGPVSGPGEWSRFARENLQHTDLVKAFFLS